VTGGPSDIGEYLISPRSFEEYRAMFALTDADLAGRVLDCPGGGASFVASAGRLGCDAVAVDPVYAVAPGDLAARMDAELARAGTWMAATSGRYVWDFYGSPERHARLRAASAGAFVRDRIARPDRYVAGALPFLPFADGSFDLVLCSHLLFTYADRLDRAFHRAALLEMVRVSRGQVRVFPLVHHAGQALPELLDPLLADLAAAGVPATVRGVAFEFLRGATAMLQLEAADRSGGTGRCR
jgi:SAM-dependent methyltransferase